MKTDGSDQNKRAPQSSAVVTLRGEIQRMTGEFEKALSKNIDPERFVRIVLTAVQTNPKLAECSRQSFLGAVMQSGQLGLEPNTTLGHAYLIPRWNGARKCMECNFQIGYQGILDLCYRSGEYKRIAAEVVYEGDEFNYEYGFDPFLRHKPCGKTQKPTHVWALYELKNGGTAFKVWTWEAVMKHAETFSESFDKSFSPWKSNNESQEGMARKTVLISLLKYAPKTVEVSNAVNADERVLNMRRVYDGGHSFFSLDPEPIETVSHEAVNPAGKEASETTPATGQPAPKSESAPPKAQAAETARKPEPETAAGAAPAGKGSGLFGKDEESALEEQYDREQAARADGPDFT